MFKSTFIHYFSALFLLLPSLSSAQDVIGSWYGKLEIQGIELRIVIHVDKNEAVYSANLDSPDQGAFGIKTDTVIVEENRFFFKIAALQAEYTGTIGQDSINGSFTQAGMNLSLDLIRDEIEKPAPPKRAQIIEAPFPYKTEEHIIQNQKDTSVYLAGTLSLAEDSEINALAILISGSGAQNRDEELLGHKPFLVISDYLCKNGISVFRYDDRGVANSKGSFSTATSADFADDAEAILNYFHRQERFRHTDIGFIGHSEGGMIAPIIASRNEETDFILLMAGPGTTLDTLLLTQNRLISEAENVPEEAIHMNQKILRTTIQSIQDGIGQTEEELSAEIKEDLEGTLSQFPDEFFIQRSRSDIINETIQTLVNPWFRYFLNFDPSVYLTKVQCPVLAINGSLDLQVPANENLNAIGEALSIGQNPHYEIQLIPGLNHLFQKTETGKPSEYASLEETFNEEVLKLMVEWLISLPK